MFKEIITITGKVNALWNESKFRECLDILNEAIIEYPGSTELVLLKTEILQVIDEEDFCDLTEDIEKPLEDIVSINPMDFDALIELVAFEHLVLDNAKKSGPLFEKGVASLNNALEKFLELYFSYLIETNGEDGIVKTKRLLQKTIENIQPIGN